jgi:hypothetical protein
MMEHVFRLTVGYDNKIIDKVVISWPATCHSGSDPQFVVLLVLLLKEHHFSRCFLACEVTQNTCMYDGIVHCFP